MVTLHNGILAVRLENTERTEVVFFHGCLYECTVVNESFDACLTQRILMASGSRSSLFLLLHLKLLVEDRLDFRVAVLAVEGLSTVRLDVFGV